MLAATKLLSRQNYCRDKIMFALLLLHTANPRAAFSFYCCFSVVSWHSCSLCFGVIYPVFSALASSSLQALSSSLLSSFSFRHPLSSFSFRQPLSALLLALFSLCCRLYSRSCISISFISCFSCSTASWKQSSCVFSATLQYNILINQSIDRSFDQ